MGRYFAMEVPIPSYIELTHANIFLHCKDIQKMLKSKIFEEVFFKKKKYIYKCVLEWLKTVFNMFVKELF